MTTTNYPLLMTEDYWATCQFSIARFYGGMKLNGRVYIIVDKNGRDSWEENEIIKREGKQIIFEPCDLILKSLKIAYRKLGRDRIIELIKDGKTEKEIIDIVKPKKKPKK